MKKWLVIFIVMLLLTNFGAYQRIVKTEAEWKRSEANVKAYASQFDNEKKQNRALQFTIEQLHSFNDSVLQALDETRKELKIKEKNIKSMQSLSSSFQKTDTIVYRDTLFKEPDLSIDTILGNKWYSVQVGLKYPSEVTVTPKFQSEKHIIVSSKKETVNPPKKFFVAKWFQKKHRVVYVNVIEKNPYVMGEDSKYIEVIK